MDNRGYKGINTGLASIIVIFVVIALTVFAALSVSTARQEKNLAGKYADSISDYWAADSECAELANAFGALWESGGGEAKIEELAAGSGALLSHESGDLVVFFERPISDVSSLHVTLRLGEEFHIEEWRMVSTDEDWTPNNKLPVWQG
ncbi:MAG: hypothetical protein EOM54_01555 [Clostridia bacterium]|nr:hypothetical protein [Clostridia bacterium]